MNAAYSCERGWRITHLQYLSQLCLRSSENSVPANFGESEFCELRVHAVLRSSDRISSPLPNPQHVHAHPQSRAMTINTMPRVGTFHTSERISGTPAA